MPQHSQHRTTQKHKPYTGRASSSNHSNGPSEATGMVTGVRGPQGNMFNVQVRGKTRKYKIGRMDGRLAIQPAEIPMGSTVILRKIKNKKGRTTVKIMGVQKDSEKNSNFTFKNQNSQSGGWFW